VRLCFADQISRLAPGWDWPDPVDGALADAIREHLAARGASFWAQLRGAAPAATDAELLAALWDLVWAGEVTNDSLAAVRAYVGAGARSDRRAPARGRTVGRPRPGRLTRLGPPAGGGRWSLVRPLLEPAPSPTEAAHATALQLVERYGVLTREAVLAEAVVGGYASVYGVLKLLEERGQLRRGYFVAGLGAAQFALPGAVDRLRATRELDKLAEPGDEPLVLAATDPAQPYGAALAWPESPGRPARTAGAIVVLRGGAPLVWFDTRSHHLVTFGGTLADPSWATALTALVLDGRMRSVEVRKVDGGPISAAITDVVRGAGFVDGYRGPAFRTPPRRPDPPRDGSRRAALPTPDR
jgi:ATP-dependent Lhr-like helicase